MCLQTQLSTLCSVIPEMYLSTSPMYHHIYIQVYLSIYNIVSYIYIYTLTIYSKPFLPFQFLFVILILLMFPHDFEVKLPGTARSESQVPYKSRNIGPRWDVTKRCRKPMSSLEKHCSYSIVIIMIYKWLANILLILQMTDGILLYIFCLATCTWWFVSRQFCSVIRDLVTPIMMTKSTLGGSLGPSRW